MAALSTHEEIEQQVRELQERRQGLGAQITRDEGDKVGLGAGGYFDQDIYGGANASKFEGYVTSIAATDEQDEEDDSHLAMLGKKTTFTAPLNLLNDISDQDKDYDPLGDRRAAKITDREDIYKKQRFNTMISPARHDPFAPVDCTSLFTTRRNEGYLT